MESKIRKVINGLEGCGKSRSHFNNIKDIATPAKPIVFAFKNYALMKEQMLGWSKHFNLPLSDFAICGFNKNYEPGQDAFTNAQTPWVVPMSARFIFISQGLLQRNRIKDLTWEIRAIKGIKPVIQEIVIDEFDFSIGIVPTLDYFINHCPDKKLKEDLSKKICEFLSRSYTREDVARFQASNEDDFNTAFWLDDADCNITILTSEILATIFLSIIGFEVVDFGDKNFHGKCKIFVETDERIGRNFFSKMNQNLTWNKLGFDVIISDCIASGMKDSSTLSVDVINHCSARGSNAFIGKNILTILSYIPKSKITEIKDCINCFVKLKNRDGYTLPYFGYDEVESLFYRDRLCQAVGRVIGYRGNTDTHILVHKDIYSCLDRLGSFELVFNSYIDGKIDTVKYNKMLCELDIKFNEMIQHRVIRGISLIPYDFDHSWNLEFEGKHEIWQSICDADERSKKGGLEKKRNVAIHKKAVCANNLDAIFEKTEGAVMKYDECKRIIAKHNLTSIGGKGTLQPAKVAKHFGLPVKYVKINGATTQTIIGLSAKK